MVAFDVLDWKCEHICPEGSCTLSTITNFEFLILTMLLLPLKFQKYLILSTFLLTAKS